MRPDNVYYPRVKARGESEIAITALESKRTPLHGDHAWTRLFQSINVQSGWSGLCNNRSEAL